MRFRIFQYTLPAPQELEDLNSFLASQRIATVTHHIIQTPGGGMLIFVVETASNASSKPGTPEGPKVDYKEQLSAEQFAIFSRLRDERKKWADAESVPVYTILTNAQLAEIARRAIRTVAELSAIEGIGQARVEKYGPRLIAVLAGQAPPGKTMS